MTKRDRWAWVVVSAITLMALLPLLPGTYWKFYWFNYRILERVSTWLS